MSTLTRLNRYFEKGLKNKHVVALSFVVDEISLLFHPLTHRGPA